MTEIIGIKFKKLGKTYYFSPVGLKFVTGDMAIVETSKGLEYGEVVVANKFVEDEKIVNSL